ncbi:MAG: A24 family peptidase [Caulobacteraceae bacterium]
MTLAAALLAIFPALVIVAALHDATSFTIPNWISGALILAFFPVALIAGLPLSTIGICLLTSFVLLLAGMGMFAAGWIGGGDAKLLAASALWLGWPGAMNFLLITALAGGALAILLMTARRNEGSILVARGPAWLKRLLDPKEAAPYGIAIAAGALVAFPASALVAAR